MIVRDFDDELTSSSSNNNKTHSCTTRQTFESVSQFNLCYSRRFLETWEQSSAELLLAIFTVLLNLLVIIKISRKPFKKKLFDKIIVAHCIVDGLTGLVDVPFFHFQRLFGYWPLGRRFALLWASFDNGINSITNLHMLYMTWARFRSIRAPNTYEKELLARSPGLVCLLIWLSGLVFWTIVTFSYGVNDFSLTINFKPSFVETILIFITWFIPLGAILPISIYIIYILHRRRQKMAKIKRPPLFRTRCSTPFVADDSTFATSGSSRYRLQRLKSCLALGPQARFQIIITSYCLQWFPSCILALVVPFYNSIPSNLVASIYWLTYTVCLTDPLVVLILYPTAVFKYKKRRSPACARLEN